VNAAGAAGTGAGAVGVAGAEVDGVQPGSSGESAGTPGCAVSVRADGDVDE
jgi:hypothetical protein